MEGPSLCPGETHPLGDTFPTQTAEQAARGLQHHCWHHSSVDLPRLLWEGRRVSSVPWTAAKWGGEPWDRGRRVHQAPGKTDCISSETPGRLRMRRTPRGNHAALGRAGPLRGRDPCGHHPHWPSRGPDPRLRAAPASTPFVCVCVLSRFRAVSSSLRPNGL